MKRTISLLLATLLALSAFVGFSASAEETDLGKPTAFTTGPALYAHAVVNSSDADAWVAWQSEHDEDFNVVNGSQKYFFLPTSAQDDRVDIYNGYDTAMTVNGVSIAPDETKTVEYNTNQNYTVKADGSTYSLKVMKSNAEAAIYINNSNADGNGTDLMTYLNADKSLSAKATGAIVDADGNIDNTAIKKIKGRGNTTWDKPKKAYNITYDKKVSVAGMTKVKKFSMLANYQDDSLSRNRFLYDLSDAVGLPYASDSRYVDFYSNGYYWGSYQMCEKVDTGAVLDDITGEEYLNEDGTVKSDFPFVMEVDASAVEGEDYFFVASNGTKVTLKAPELDADDPNYQTVLDYAKSKYDTFARTASNKNGKVSQYGDVDSLTKLYLINELGKNWDSGVSSCFFTYKPDENGNYKFYGSPVWDYDNSLGNATGVARDLRNMGVSDYEEYTGWWCKFKGKNSGENSSSNNIINQLSVNNEIVAAAPGIWFNDFVPAINHFSGYYSNPLEADEIYSRTEYFDYIKNSAEMNYTSGWLLTTSSWICDHSSLNKATYDYDKKTYSVSNTATRYQQTFEGMYNYAADWMVSRAAWLSNEFMQNYNGYYLLGDVTRDGQITVNDATQVQYYAAQLKEFTPAEFELGDVSRDNHVTVSDATLIQKYAAELIDDFRNPSSPEQPTNPEPVTQPATEPVTDPQDDTYTVVFSDVLGWGEPMYCYYYADGFYPVNWPGTQMTAIGKDDFGNNAYSVEVPKQSEYVIFTNNTVQTEKIPFDGTDLHYFAVNSVNDKGRYDYGAFLND